jgi:hypothetical protein
MNISVPSYLEVRGDILIAAWPDGTFSNSDLAFEMSFSLNAFKEKSEQVLNQMQQSRWPSCFTYKNWSRHFIVSSVPPSKCWEYLKIGHIHLLPFVSLIIHYSLSAYSMILYNLCSSKSIVK